MVLVSLTSAAFHYATAIPNVRNGAPNVRQRAAGYQVRKLRF
jgi:hypothetical protein